VDFIHFPKGGQVELKNIWVGVWRASLQGVLPVSTQYGSDDFVASRQLGGTMRNLDEARTESKDEARG
jgi:hypothetical protein